VVLSSRLFSTFPQSKCQPSNQLANTTTGFKAFGETPDICHIVMFYWFEPVLYLDPVAKFPETTKKGKPGFFVGFADNVGDFLKFKLLKDDLSTVLH
jgi:hypothetical protein